MELLPRLIDAADGRTSRTFEVSKFLKESTSVLKLCRRGICSAGCLKAACLRGSQFSGEIPSDFFSKMKSLKKVWLSDYNEVHLGNNQFRGTIPSTDQPNLMSCNGSNNNFSSFRGNDGLSGSRDLKGSSEPPSDVGVAKLAAIITATASRRRDVDFDGIGNRSNGNIAAELEMARTQKCLEMEDREEVLLQKMANGVVAVVKRIREMNTLSITEFNAEIRKLGRLLSRIVEGIAKGLGYLCTELDSSNLPHGNLKSSTVPTFIANYM
uniref:Uncharacterized protein n=1 Tax=Salix viminalis TaxID=40686 RepID=A0A6N2MZM9_SALVM